MENRTANYCDRLTKAALEAAKKDGVEQFRAYFLLTSINGDDYFRTLKGINVDQDEYKEIEESKLDAPDCFAYLMALLEHYAEMTEYEYKKKADYHDVVVGLFFTKNLTVLCSGFLEKEIMQGLDRGHQLIKRNLETKEIEPSMLVRFLDELIETQCKKAMQSLLAKAVEQA